MASTLSFSLLINDTQPVHDLLVSEALWELQVLVRPFTHVSWTDRCSDNSFGQEVRQKHASLSVIRVRMVCMHSRVDLKVAVFFVASLISISLSMCLSPSAPHFTQALFATHLHESIRHKSTTVRRLLFNSWIFPFGLVQIGLKNSFSQLDC